jgi:hypothetical protein
VNHHASDSLPAGELHLYPVGADQWIGVAYFDGINQGRTDPMPSMDAAMHEAAQRFRVGLKPVIWSQDGGMIVSEE